MARSFLLGVATRNFATPDADDYADARAGPMLRIVPSRAMRSVLVLTVALPAAFAMTVMIKAGDSVSWTLFWLLLFGSVLFWAVSWFIVAGRTVLVHADDVTPGDWVAVLPWMPQLLAPASQVVAKFHHHGRVVHPMQVALRNGNTFNVNPATLVHVVRVTDRWARRRPSPSYEVRWSDVHETVVRLLSALWDRSLSGDREVVDRPSLNSLATKHEDTNGERAINAAIRMGLLTERRRGKGLFLSETGKVWLAQILRERGVEIIPGSKEKLPMTFNNEGIVVTGDVQASNLSTAENVQQSVDRTNVAHEDGAAAAVAELIALIRAGHFHSEVSAREAAEIDDAADVLEHAHSSGDVHTPAGRTAVRTCLRLAGELIRGASGNALWEALKTLAG